VKAGKQRSIRNFFRYWFETSTTTTISTSPASRLPKLNWTRLNYDPDNHDNRRLLEHRAKNCMRFVIVSSTSCLLRCHCVKNMLPVNQSSTNVKSREPRRKPRKRWRLESSAPFGIFFGIDSSLLCVCVCVCVCGVSSGGLLILMSNWNDFLWCRLTRRCCEIFV
jgi:hypothetical protein